MSILIMFCQNATQPANKNQALIFLRAISSSEVKFINKKRQAINFAQFEQDLKLKNEMKWNEMKE